MKANRLLVSSLLFALALSCESAGGPGTPGASAFDYGPSEITIHEGCDLQAPVESRHHFVYDGQGRVTSWVEEHEGGEAQRREHSYTYEGERVAGHARILHIDGEYLETERDTYLHDEEGLFLGWQHTEQQVGDEEPYGHSYLVERDAQGRLIRALRQGEEPEETSAWTWDEASGQVATFTSGDDVFAVNYDAQGRPESLSWSDEGHVVYRERLIYGDDGFLARACVLETPNAPCDASAPRWEYAVTTGAGGRPSTATGQRLDAGGNCLARMSYTWTAAGSAWTFDQLWEMLPVPPDDPYRRFYLRPAAR